jgi:hypothetical protein
VNGRSERLGAADGKSGKYDRGCELHGGGGLWRSRRNQWTTTMKGNLSPWFVSVMTIPASKSFNESTLIIITKQRVLVYSNWENL